MTLSYILGFSISLALMLIATPKMIEFAKKINFVEQPNLQNRKIHTEPKPYLASVLIFSIFWIVFFLASKGFSNISLRDTISSKEKINILIIFISSFIIFAIGIVDDWYKINNKDLRALPKFLIQLFACALVFWADIRFEGFFLPIYNIHISLPIWMQFIFTVVWLFGVTTVINFTDGIDGLAGSISCISAGTLFIVAQMKGHSSYALISIILVGVCLGYLKYNKFPSKILMGDSGATFLGFMLGIISLGGVMKHATILSTFIPIIALGVPIFDNIYVVFKRIKEKKPIYVGDNSQAHYRLMKKGLNQMQAVTFLCLISLSLGLFSIIIALLNY